MTLKQLYLVGLFFSFVLSCAQEKAKLPARSISSESAKIETNSDDVVVKPIDEKGGDVLRDNEEETNRPENPFEVEKDPEDKEKVSEGGICTSGDQKTQSCDFTNGEGREDYLCVGGTWKLQSNGCILESCDQGYARNGNVCLQTNCDAKIAPSTCIVSPGLGSGTFERACTAGQWVNSSTCAVTSCDDPLYQFNPMSKSCERRPIEIIYSKTKGGVSAPTFDAHERVYFRLNNVGTSQNAPEYCSRFFEEDSAKCSENSQFWIDIATDDNHQYSSYSWEMIGPHTPYSITAGSYTIYARLKGQPETTVSKQATMNPHPIPSITISGSRNGADVGMNANGNADIWMRFENIGRYSLVDHPLARYCIDSPVTPVEQKCDKKINFKTLVAEHDSPKQDSGGVVHNPLVGFVYDSNGNGGKGAWYYKFAAGTVGASDYDIYIESLTSGHVTRRTYRVDR